MNTPEWTLIERMKDASALSDLLNEADRRTREAEYADLRTRKAREEIKALARSLTEREAAALVSSLIAAIGASGWGHTDAATSACEGLLDAHIALEG
jgi:hypothetical protein